jgi:hypothetical protein
MTLASQTYELAHVVLPSTSRLKLMAMFGAYFDASGTDDGASCLSVAGVVTPATRWKTFNSKWWDILSKADVAPDKEGYIVFHMTDFESGWGKFKGWDKDKKIFVMKKLVTAMAGRIKIVVARSVNIKEFLSVQNDFPNFRHQSAFTFCFMQCVIDLSGILDELKVFEPVAYMFEHGDGYGEELGILKRAVERDSFLRDKFRWESFSDSLTKKKYPAFQAADIIAFEGQEEMLNYIIPGEALRDARKSLNALRMAFSKSKAYMIGGPTHEPELRKLAPGFIGPNLL